LATAIKQLQLAPLGAGDLIDRTVRLYRRHFMALVRACAPPVIVSALGTVILSVSVRSMSFTSSGGRLLLYILFAFLSILIWFLGLLAQLVVMGGASRNLVMHLLLDKPVTTRLIYRSVRSRFWKLLLATLAVVLCLIFSGVMASVAWFMATLLVIVILWVVSTLGLPWLIAIMSLILNGASLLLFLYVFFLFAGRVAYVPQVLMVEGKGVLESVNRSVELARGNVRRLMGLFLFTMFAWASAVMLLLAPHGWIGNLVGLQPIIPLFTDTSHMPSWYIVSYEVIIQVSTILLAPVWMMGMSLLYVDERVRHEGYDVELLAAQRFGEMPAVPVGVHAPLAPALAAPQDAETYTRPQDKFPGSMLGLN
jgi:hypothetical protein